MKICQSQRGRLSVLSSFTLIHLEHFPDLTFFRAFTAYWVSFECSLSELSYEGSDCFSLPAQKLRVHRKDLLPDFFFLDAKLRNFGWAVCRFSGSNFNCKSLICFLWKQNSLLLHVFLSSGFLFILFHYVLQLERDNSPVRAEVSEDGTDCCCGLCPRLNSVVCQHENNSSNIRIISHVFRVLTSKDLSECVCGCFCSYRTAWGEDKQLKHEIQRFIGGLSAVSGDTGASVFCCYSKKNKNKWILEAGAAAGTDFVSLFSESLLNSLKYYNTHEPQQELVQKINHWRGSAQTAGVCRVREPVLGLCCVNAQRNVFILLKLYDWLWS